MAADFGVAKKLGPRGVPALEVSREVACCVSVGRQAKIPRFELAKQSKHGLTPNLDGVTNLFATDTTLSAQRCTPLMARLSASVLVASLAMWRYARTYHDITVGGGTWISEVRWSPHAYSNRQTVEHN